MISKFQVGRTVASTPRDRTPQRATRPLLGKLVGATFGFITAAVLTACGGGGGGDTAQETFAAINTARVTAPNAAPIANAGNNQNVAKVPSIPAREQAQPLVATMESLASPEARVQDISPIKAYNQLAAPQPFSVALAPTETSALLEQSASALRAGNPIQIGTAREIPATAHEKDLSSRLHWTASAGGGEDYHPQLQIDWCKRHTARRSDREPSVGCRVAVPRSWQPYRAGNFFGGNEGHHPAQSGCRRHQRRGPHLLGA